MLKKNMKRPFGWFLSYHTGNNIWKQIYHYPHHKKKKKNERDYYQNKWVFNKVAWETLLSGK